MFRCRMRTPITGRWNIWTRSTGFRFRGNARRRLIRARAEFSGRWRQAGGLFVWDIKIKSLNHRGHRGAQRTQRTQRKPIYETLRSLRLKSWMNHEDGELQRLLRILPCDIFTRYAFTGYS